MPNSITGFSSDLIDSEDESALSAVAIGASSAVTVGEASTGIVKLNVVPFPTVLST